MPVNPKNVGEQIYALRKGKGITQNDLGERLSVSPQAVSKWERGETLPDTAILPDLANVLETSVDNLLCGGQRQMQYKRKVTVAEIAEGIACFEKLGELLGRDSYFYLGAIEGVDQKMNIELEKYLSESFKKRMGMGFSRYLKNLRVKHAVFLMEHGVVSIKNVAFLCGFRDPLYFSKVFRADMGISPKEYLQR